MDTTRFDRISRLFADRRRSRSQIATPAANSDGTPGSTEFLFVQSFESGSIAPRDGADGTYTVTLQHGLGQTIYFSDRPERIVGVAPTPQFLDGLGFNAVNPPNAALVIESEEGGTNIAVVELTNPTYDTASSTATYDVAVLENLEGNDNMQFQETTVDLATISASFGSAHLFIDDCTDDAITCFNTSGQDVGGAIKRAPMCWTWDGWCCTPCRPEELPGICNAQYGPYCDGGCTVKVYGDSTCFN